MSGSPPRHETAVGRKKLKPDSHVKDTIEQDAAAIHRATTVPDLERKTEGLMSRAADKVDWQLTDHGIGHVNRVRENTKTLVDAVNQVSIARRTLGHPLGEDELTELDMAALTHDIGRSVSDARHAKAGADEIRTWKKELPRDSERERVASLVELHSKTELRRRYGTADLETLVQRGVIDRDTAFKAGLVRLADGLDADRRRAHRNTQGDSYESVKQKLDRQATPQEREISLAHWEGHRGIERAEVRPAGDKLNVCLRINPDAARSHSDEVAFKALDVLHEVQTTALRRHVEVTFQSSDSGRLHQWYNQNRETLAPGLSGLDVFLEQSEGE